MNFRIDAREISVSIFTPLEDLFYSNSELPFWMLNSAQKHIPVHRIMAVVQAVLWTLVIVTAL